MNSANSIKVSVFRCFLIVGPAEPWNIDEVQKWGHQRRVKSAHELGWPSASKTKCSRLVLNFPGPRWVISVVWIWNWNKIDGRRTMNKNISRYSDCNSDDGRKDYLSCSYNYFLIFWKIFRCVKFYLDWNSTETWKKRLKILFFLSAFLITLISRSFNICVMHRYEIGESLQITCNYRVVAG